MWVAVISPGAKVHGKPGNGKVAAKRHYRARRSCPEKERLCQNCLGCASIVAHLQATRSHAAQQVATCVSLLLPWPVSRNCRSPGITDKQHGWAGL